MSHLPAKRREHDGLWDSLEGLLELRDPQSDGGEEPTLGHHLPAGPTSNPGLFHLVSVLGEREGHSGGAFKDVSGQISRWVPQGC